MFDVHVGQLVQVEWDDAANIAEWMDLDEIARWAKGESKGVVGGAWNAENIGWITYLDDHCVVVSARRAGTEDDQAFGLSERLPWAIIKQVTIIHEGR